MNRTKGTISGTMHRRTARRPSFGAASPFTTLLITVALLGILAAQRPGVEASVVHTFRQTSSQLGQKVTSSTLMWESYSASDLKQLEYAIQGGKYISEDEHYPIYVCRVTIDGVQTSGHTEKQKQSHLCVVSYLKEVKKYKRFDVLVNKGHLGKISWRPWRKFNAGIPLGAISVDDYSYIARRRVNHQSIGDHLGADFTLGRFDPTVGLGKILVVEEHHEREYDEGEVLVETEPFRYELRDIILDRIRTDVRVNTTELVSGILENKYDTTNHIETVLSYSYDHTQYWGTHEGIARGLVTKVYEKDSSKPTEINWGLKYSEKRYETKSVSASLPPGTAINVTIMGEYVTMEAPYVAKLFAFYYGSKESVSRNISAEVRKNYLKGIKLDYSSIYWIENGTFVPTTTTTTTSTTTHATTTLGSSELKPIDEPPLVYMADIGRSSGASSDSKPSASQDDAGNDINDNMIPNESRENYAENLKHMKGAANPGASHSTRLYCWTNSILILLISLTVRVFG